MEDDRRYTSFEELVAYKEELDAKVAQDELRLQKLEDARLESVEISFDHGLEVSTGHLSEIIRLFANEKRLEILEILLDGPATAGKLAYELEEQPNRLSRHLSMMEEGRLVSIERRGVMKIYRLQERARIVLAAAASAAAGGAAAQGA